MRLFFGMLITGVAVAVPILVASLYIAYVFWCTDVVRLEVLKEAVLNEGSQMYNLWKENPVPTIVSFYAFNYTNVEAILSGKEKPRVSQVGPYVYRELVEKKNISFNEDGTMITFQDHRYHEYIPEMSNGQLDDTIYIPNLPLIAVLGEKVKWMEKLALRGMLTGIRPKPFTPVTVEELAWGFGDTFSVVTGSLASLRGRPVPENFGILSERTGLSKDRVTVGSGIPELENVGKVLRFNGKERIGVWDDPRCDDFTGSDGIIYAGKTLSRHSTLHLYAKDFCRRLPLIYKEDVVTADGFPAYRFVFKEDMFAPGDVNPDNQCFCNGTDCLPSGTFNLERCMYGAPLVLSMPHFLGGDPSLLEGVEGLHPVPQLHAPHLDVHETLGLPLANKMMFQFSIVIRHSSIMPIYSGIANGTILPVAWLQFETGAITPDLYNLLYEVTFQPKRVQFIGSWGSLLSVILTTSFLIWIYREKIHILYYKT